MSVLMTASPRSNAVLRQRRFLAHQIIIFLLFLFLFFLLLLA